MKVGEQFHSRRSPETVGRESGFTLVTALFLLVVVALLSAYIVTFRNVQQSTVLYAQQGARAMQAVNAGIEWGIYQAVRNNTCAMNLPFTAAGTALSAYSITVNCVSSTHDEAGVPIITYVLTSTAQAGVYGTLDYVYRSLRATVSAQPP